MLFVWGFIVVSFFCFVLLSLPVGLLVLCCHIVGFTPRRKIKNDWGNYTKGAVERVQCQTSWIGGETEP